MPALRHIIQRLFAVLKPKGQQETKSRMDLTGVDTAGKISSTTSPHSLLHDSGLEHAPRFQDLEQLQVPLCTVERLSIDVSGETVRGFLHLPAEYSHDRVNGINAAAILLPGAGGGVVGPSGIYISIADKLATLRQGVPVLRLDYRYPANTKPCSKDVISAMDYLQDRFSITKFVLVGWSFGGAPVFTVAAHEKDRVVACATIASQTAAAGGIRELAPRPVLLLHGTGDQTLSPRCSQALHDAYGTKGERTLKLFTDDDHSLRANSHEAEALLRKFILRCVGVELNAIEEGQIIEQALIADKEKVQLMKEGGDLDGRENVK